MDVIINFDVEICIPQSNSSRKIFPCLGRQFQVAFNMVLLTNNEDIKSSHVFFLLNEYDKASFEVIIHVVERGSNNGRISHESITSLSKSPCFWSSASMALSRIPPDVALKNDKKLITHFVFILKLLAKRVIIMVIIWNSEDRKK
jgi:hypothetical protein